ncbi:MAG: Panacea domain-containing protein [Dyadobacter sp.]|uniref:Panacea domain-containing protein n=1 Tax=Dyadobacter sp. TaxID=1914288 RepID=UPI003265C917
MNRISNMISFFDSKVKKLYKTKLNKLLFYADFLSYSRTGYAISGISYRAIQFGPVPSQYQKMYVKLSDDAKLSIEQVEVGNGNYGEMISTSKSFDPSGFNENELKTLQDVCELYGKMQASALVEASHLEKGWIDNEQSKSFINFQESAFYLVENTLLKESAGGDKHESPE